VTWITRLVEGEMKAIMRQFRRSAHVRRNETCLAKRCHPMGMSFAKTRKTGKISSPYGTSFRPETTKGQLPVIVFW
jgi:hypothetical protein